MDRNGIKVRAAGIDCAEIPHYEAVIVYNKETKDENLNSEKAIGIDIGINNLCTITSNDGKICNIINGRPLKSINQFYNKSLARIKSMNNKKNIKTSKRIKRLNFKRQCKIDDYLHKASRKVVEIMSRNKIKYCFIGHNDGWKQECNIGKTNTQNFVQIPHNRLYNLIQYKAEAEGIQVILQEESYTSKASYLDKDAIPTYNPEEENKKYSFSGKRIHRGLYNSADGTLLNADVNGAANIYRKHFDETPFTAKSLQNVHKITIAA